MTTIVTCVWTGLSFLAPQGLRTAKEYLVGSSGNGGKDNKDNKGNSNTPGALTADLTNPTGDSSGNLGQQVGARYQKDCGLPWVAGFSPIRLLNPQWATRHITETN
jgi:hypothetical protein